MSNPNTIQFISKKGPLITGILILCIVSFVALILIYGIFSPDTLSGDRPMYIIGLVLFCVLPGIFGVFSIISYFGSGNKLRESLAKYGERNLIENIQNHTVHVYQNPRALTNGKVYFTDKLVVDPEDTVFAYNEISLMYKFTLNTKYGSQPHLCFELLDGSTWYLCKNISDEQISSYMSLCAIQNSNIIFGFTNENLTQHKERVKQYKNGTLLVPKVTL